MRLLSVLILVAVFLGSCVSKNYKPEPQSLTVMTYNVENLFDNEDDPGKNDETYLPRSKKQSNRFKAKCKKAKKPHWIRQCLETDWTDEKLKRKMQRLASVILQVKEGNGPDFLILQEVENKKIVERLRTEYLQAGNYKPTVLIEGPDKRGIDVAFLSRFPIVGNPELNLIKLAHPTRGILQAQFALPDSSKVTLLGVHFPSQGSPVAARKTAVETLIKVKKSLPKDELIIVGGDFNITSKEDGQHGLFSTVLAEHFLVSHHIGCDSCEGTHSYRGSWSFLDALLFSKNFESSPWVINYDSVRLVNKSVYQLSRFGTPARFSDGRSQIGVSDHYPLAVDIYPKAEVKK